MAGEPLPNVTRADALRKGQIRGRIRTGARTATKEQEREYLDRFAKLRDHPEGILPQWKGQGGDPFAALGKRLRRLARWQKSPFMLRWFGRGKRLEHAYAQTLRVLKAGRIPSFAHLKFRGREVNYVMRGRGLRDKLVALHNWDQDDVRLLAYLDASRRGRTILVSLGSDLIAQTPGQKLDPAWSQRILSKLGIDARATGEGHIACSHRAHGRPGFAYGIKEIQTHVELCRACVQKQEGVFEQRYEAHVLGPGGTLTFQRRLVGTDYTVHPESAKADLDALLVQASDDALAKSKTFDGVNDLDLLTWADEALAERLEQRPGGFLLVGDNLWLGEYESAAKQLGSTEGEQRALAEAWRRWPPRLRASDATISKLLEGGWEEHGPELLSSIAEGFVSDDTVAELARMRPGEALAELERAATTEKRFSSFPRVSGLAPPLRLAHDLFKAHRTANAALFARRLGEGVRDPATRALTLALARAFGQSASIEWQVPPHEKDQAVFYEPYARTLARSDPATYGEGLAQLAEALQVPAPTVAPAPTA